MEELLNINKVSLSYNTSLCETLAVKDLSFSVNKGEFIAIIGPSGSGKTTILSLISGLIKPSSGSITFNNKNSNSVKIGYMFQRDELFNFRTVEKNVFLPLEIKKINNPENKQYAISLLEKYGLKEFKKSYPNQLSGGMRQRVALIRTLTLNPDLLLLDEPFSALDYQTRLSVSEDVYKIIRNENKTAILVTHDISEAISVADKIIVLTKRPATVKSIHNTNYNKKLSPLLRRKEKSFGEQFEILWRELNNEGTFNQNT